MAISKSANTYNRQNWEEADFPILCQTCLGDNPYVRMLKETFGSECKICCRPFTVFRWCPGTRMRYKKTEICQTCSRLKNVCQTCLFDLEYGLPVQVRDKGLQIRDDLPRHEVNREYYTQTLDNATNSRTEPLGAVGKANPPSNDMLKRFARTSPYYKRNRPHICSFWVKGECKRGEECPYRHEMPTDPDNPLSNQNMKDRYYGVDDPVAEKLLQQIESTPKLPPPADKTITSLYIGGIDNGITEQEIRSHFYQFGEIDSISMVTKQNCAFVNFSTRQSAETAAEKSYNKLVLRGTKLKILWGKSVTPTGKGVTTSVAGAGTGGEFSEALPLPPGVEGASQFYPSQDPHRLGTNTKHGP